MILTILLAAMALSFLAHVILLFVSFGRTGFNGRRYFFSHFTLWMAGAIACLICWLYAHEGASTLIDIFDTLEKRILLMLVVLAVSLLAHGIVKLFVMPQYR